MDIVFLGIKNQVTADCPANPLEDVRDCTANILPELNTEALSEGPDASRRRIQVLQDSCTYVSHFSVK